ncbi:MAG: hypothetical protein P8163_11835 [Candidatus Thiodiazotropha sp.]|jgi:hypothetical protein
MKTVYDMSTGQIIETGLNRLSAPQSAPQIEAAADLQLGLQLVTCETAAKRTLPPELVLADFNAFIEEMS